MKKKIIPIIAFAFLITISASGQNKNCYWIVESNPSIGKFTIIRIYDEERLLHEEKVEGKILDITKKRVRRSLNKKLKEVVLAREKSTRTQTVTTSTIQ